MRRKEAADGSFILVFLGDGETNHNLELTWLKDWDRPYDLGDNEFHLAFTVDDYDAAHALHSRWAVSAMKTPEWAFILLKILTDTGWRLCLRGKSESFLP